MSSAVIVDLDSTIACMDRSLLHTILVAIQYHSKSAAALYSPEASHFTMSSRSKRLHNQGRNRRQRESRRRKQQEYLNTLEELKTSKEELRLCKIACHRMKSMITHPRKSSVSAVRPQSK